MRVIKTNNLIKPLIVLIGVAATLSMSVEMAFADDKTYSLAHISLPTIRHLMPRSLTVATQSPTPLREPTSVLIRFLRHTTVQKISVGRSSMPNHQLVVPDQRRSSDL